jgi:hypothetical protein
MRIPVYWHVTICQWVVVPEQFKKCVAYILKSSRSILLGLKAGIIEINYVSCKNYTKPIHTLCRKIYGVL